MYSFNEFHALDEGKKKGLWANIHAKRKRGERPARPGEKDYPKTLNVEEVEQIDEVAPIVAGAAKVAAVAARGLAKGAVTVGKATAKSAKGAAKKTAKEVGKGIGYGAATAAIDNYRKEEVEQVDEGKSDRPLGVMHHFARGVKQKRGAKKDEGGKYLKMQTTKKQNKKSADADAHREKQKNERGLTMYPEETIKEEDYDRMKDRRMERGGVGGNQRRFSSASSNKKHGTGKTALQKEMEKKHGKGATAMDIVKAEITAKYGKGAIKK